MHPQSAPHQNIESETRLGRRLWPTRSWFSYGLFAFIGALAIALSLLPLTYAQGQAAVATVSAANFRSVVAPDSIVASFGAQLAIGVKVAETVPLPTELLGTVVTVIDSGNASYPAQLLFVSPNQINFIVPAQAAPGTATVSVKSGSGQTTTGPLEISLVAPGIFTANQNGEGVPSADVLHFLQNGQQTSESAGIIGPDQTFIARAVNLGTAGDRVFLVFFLTGLRKVANTDGNNGNGSAENVKVVIGGISVTPLYAGTQGSFAGLDQINLEIPRTLLDASIPGSKQVSILVKVPGYPDSNIVEIALAPPDGATPLVITGVTAPERVLVNSTIQITGTGISTQADKNRISFGEGSGDPRPGQVSTATATQVGAVVPFGALTGSIALTSDGKRWTSPSSLPVRTSFSAVLKDTEGQLLPPIVGARVCFPDCNVPGALTTNLQPGGWFVLPDTPVGARRVFVIEPVGQSAQLPFNRTLVSSPIVADRDNHLPQDVFVQAIYGPSGIVGTPSGFASDQSGTQAVAANALELSIEGFKLSVPAGAEATFPNGSKSGLLTLTPVKNSLTPVPPPPGVFSSAVVQISPFGTKLNPGGKLIFPNRDNLPPSPQPILYRYDLNSAAFVDTGVRGLVSSDGKSIETPAGAITEATIYFVGVPQETTTLVGRVLESDGLTPVRGVVVLAAGRQTTTDGNGGFSLKDIALGPFGTVAFSGDNVRTKELKARSQSTISVTASYLRPTGRTDTASGESGAIVPGGITNVAPLRLTSASSNQPPVILATGYVSLYATETRSVPVIVYDLDPQQTISSLNVSGPAFVTTTNNGSGSFTIRVAPGPSDSGTYNLTLTATDSGGGTSSVETSIVVFPVPTAESQAVTLNEDSPKGITLMGFDAGGAPLTFTLLSQPSNGVLTGVAPDLVYTPNANFDGNDAFTFRVSNGVVSSSTATISIKVDPVNDAPVLTITCPNGSILHIGDPLACVISARDVDTGQIISLSAQNLPAGAEFNAALGDLTWTPQSGQTGSYEITFTASDDGTPPLTDTRQLRVEVVNPIPVLSSLNPPSAFSETPGLVLSVTGDGFVNGSVVQWNGSPRATTFVDATHVTAVITPTDLSLAGQATVKVVNPIPGGGDSNTLIFAIDNPVPVLGALVPDSEFAGGPAFLLTLNGSNFVSTSEVRWNGSPRTTTVLNSNQLTAAISAADIAAVGTPTVTVFTPSPGGGTSSGLTFTIVDPAPVISSTSPPSGIVGSGDTPVIITGQNFVAGAIARVNGADRSTMFGSSTQLTVTISAADLATAGTLNLTVVNPTPGNPESAIFPFNVNNPLPVIGSLSPDNLPTGNPQIDILVNGSAFITGSTVLWNGVARTTTFVNANQLSVLIPATDFAVGNVADVSVTTPGPGGGTSSSLPFTVNNPLPGSIGLNPTSAITGGPGFTLSVEGSGFVSNSVIRWDGVDRPTTFVDANTVTTNIPASLIQVAGAPVVTVFNPLPGGGSSPSKVFTIDNGLPITTSINPSVVASEGPDFSLQVNGSDFIASSVVEINGSPRATMFVNSGELTATILAADIAAIGNANITVTTPAPGGGTSSPALVLTIGNPVPILATLDPTFRMTGPSDFFLNVTGSKFAPGAMIALDGVTRFSTGDDTSLSTTIVTSDTEIGKIIHITVVNPGPAGGPSNIIDFPVINPAPVTTLVEPTSFQLGSGPTEISVQGTGFAPNTIGYWNGSPRPTNVVNDSEIIMTVLATDLMALATNIPVYFISPTPGGGQTATTLVEVTNPAPDITSFNPPFAIGGDAAFTLTITGQNMVDGVVFMWNNSPRPTTYVSPTECTALISAADILTVQTVVVKLENPGGIGGNIPLYEVVGPVVNTVDPDTVGQGSGAFTLTVNGQNFLDGSVVKINGADRVTTFVNSTQLTAEALASDTTDFGLHNVQVTNPGNNTSNTVTYNVPMGFAPFDLSSTEEFLSAWSVNGRLSIGRERLTAIRLGDGRVLVVGGASQATGDQPAQALSVADIFDPATGRWTRAADMKFGRVGHTVSFIPNDDGGIVLVVGGSGTRGDDTSARTAEMYIVAENRWREVPAPEFAHVNHSATVLADGRVLIVGGESENGAASSAAELFDPVQMKWTRLTSLATPRANHQSTLLSDGRVVIIGGENTAGPLSTVEVFDPATTTWSSVKSMAQARTGHTATLLKTGRVLVVGGKNGDANGSAEIFDPASGQWSSTGNLTLGRSGHSAAVLADGSVLIGGGRSIDGRLLAACERFDIDAGTWSEAPALNQSRAGHAAIVLSDGSVLVAGGIGTNENRPNRK